MCTHHVCVWHCRSCTLEDVNAVIQIVEKMSDLLVDERGENSQQGDCLVYLLTEDILEQVVAWCLTSGVYENKIKYELLKILESLIRYGVSLVALTFTSSTFTWIVHWRRILWLTHRVECKKFYWN
mgnify:CR=1 FL=1